MKSGTQEKQRLKNALQQAYMDKEYLDAGETWQSNVMQHIRRLPHPMIRESFFHIFEQFVWRLSPAVLVMIVILTICLFQSDLIASSGVFDELVSSSNELTLAQAFGL